MSATDEKKPERDEITNQLERLLASKRFSKATNQADFLRLVVTLTLAGKRTTEEVIGKVLFPKFKKKKSSDVRVTARSLRKKLQSYYAHEGRADPVIISLPKPQPDGKTPYLAGEQYRPRFSWSPYTRANNMFRLGQNYLAQKTPSGVAYAVAHFIESIQLDPNHIPAHLSLAETLCLQALLGAWDSKELFCAAAAVAAEAVALSPKSWHAYAILGTARLFLRDRRLALLAFKKALSIDRIETEKYPWYHLCLLVLGKTEKGLALADALADESSHDPYALARYGLLLYAARRFDEAWTQARTAIDIDFRCWTGYLVLALVELAGGKSKAFSYIESASPGSSNDDHYVFPGLVALCHKLKHDTDAEENFMLHIWNLIKKPTHPSLTQSAFAFMAQGRNKSALWALDYACTRCEPIILLAESLPVFDPLRKYKQFRNLVRRRIKSRSTPCPELIKFPGPPYWLLYYAGSQIPSRPTWSSDDSLQE